MRKRARMISSLAVLLVGALGMLSATQTWFHVQIVSSAESDLQVLGSQAVSVLVPMSLAALALGLVLAISGKILRYVLGALTLVIGVGMTIQTATIALQHPVHAIAPVVSTATGVAGDASVEKLIQHLSVTAWPVCTAIVWVFMALAGVWVLLTANTWKQSTRRYETTQSAHVSDESTHEGVGEESAVDALSSWDDLSRGQDPTQ